MQKAAALATILISALIGLSGLETALRGGASAGWPTARAIVIASEVEATVVQKDPAIHAGDREVRYRPRITYSYTAQGRTHTNQRYAVDEITYSQHRAGAIVREHPPKREFTIRYRPGMPSYSVIATGSSHRSWIMAAGGLCGVVWGIRRWIQVSRQRPPDPAD